MIINAIASPIAFKIAGFSVYWYGLIMSGAILTGVLFAGHIFKKKLSFEDYEKFYDVIPFVVVWAIIGARLFYIIGDWKFYFNNPNEIIMLHHGGLSIYGALLFGFLALLISSKIKKFNFLQYCDIITLTLPLCQSIGRWGNYFNQEAYGAPYDGFLKLYIEPNHRYSQFQNVEFYHPAFLYESILNLILFILLFTISLKCKNIKAGTIACLYLLLYSVIRILIETIRIDSVCYVFNIPVAIFIAILTIIFSLILFFIIQYKKV